MNPSDQLLCAAIARRTETLVSSIPADRDRAIVALVSEINRLPSDRPESSPVDSVTGVLVPTIGASLALQLTLESLSPTGSITRNMDKWAGWFLDACREIARAELALAHVETGFMRLAARSDNGIDAYIAHRHSPERWRERMDDAWWSSWLAGTRPVAGESPIERARSLVDRLARKYDLALDLSIDGMHIQMVHEVLTSLLVLIDIDDGVARDRYELAITVAGMIDASIAEIASVLDALTLGSANASWHAAVPGIADPPLIYLSDNRIAISRRGLTTDPFRFLTRELRRRAPDAYHNAAAGREAEFRADLNALFRHRRFVTCARTIGLKGEQGSLRTDIDAAVFDRKTGTLALFELKTHEPFARSTEEMLRRRENMHAAGRQVAGVLDWINRHGADEILNRLDRETARQFRVQKVLPFVLGRYVMDAPPQQRAIWASWPQVLRVLDGRRPDELGGNPLATLATRLQKDTTPISPQDVTEVSHVDLGDFELRVHPRR